MDLSESLRFLVLRHATPSDESLPPFRTSAVMPTTTAETENVSRGSLTRPFHGRENCIAVI